MKVNSRWMRKSIAAFLLSATALPALPQSASKAGKSAPAKTAAFLGEPMRFAVSGVKEPSGVAYHPVLKHLFVVGDEGSLVELDKDARLVRKHPAAGNLEDLAVHTPTGNLLLLSEKKSELILYDPAAGRELRRWKISRARLLGQAPGERNTGFEGLAFREDKTRTGGGVFYLVHQNQPAVVVGLDIDFAAPSGPLKAEVLSRFALSEKNAKAATYAPSLDRLLVLSARKGIVVLRMDGTVEADYKLGGSQPEGMCLDGDGNLWVAEDKGKALLKFSGALQGIADRLRRKTSR